MVKVLFDWDNPDLDYVYALKRGIKLIVFSVCRPLGIRFKYIEEIYTETDRHAKTIAKLNEMLGVETVFGIRDIVSDAKPNVVKYLKDSGQDVRRHVHIGFRGPDRKRLWFPPLIQSMDTWHYEIQYFNGIRVKLKEGELPIWHIDRPYRLATYIDFIYEMKGEEKRTQ